MDQQPPVIPPAEPAPSPVPPVTPQPAMNPYVVSTEGESRGLAITALVLSLVAFMTGIFVAISAPLAITAIIIGSMVVKQRKPGEAMAIAAVIVSIIVLLFVAFLAYLSLRFG